jgi:sugar lactone lactonase YvrE
MTDTLASLFESTQAERWATGFEFTEGPLWHPDGYFTFVDIRTSRVYKLAGPGERPEIVRENTGNGNGNTFDLNGTLSCARAAIDRSRGCTPMDEWSRSQYVMRAIG